MPLRSRLKNPAGTNNRLDVAKVALEDVVLVKLVVCAFTLPPVIVTLVEFCKAMLPRPVTLELGTFASEMVTLADKLPPPVSSPPASTLTVFGTALGTLAKVTVVSPIVTLLVREAPP